MRVVPETIYRWIYRDFQAGGTLWKDLRRQHKKRRQQPRFGKIRSRIPDRVSIHERPKAVETRERFGDWEGDTVMGAQGQGAVITLVARKSRYLLAGKLAGKVAKSLNLEANLLLKTLPTCWRQTLTLDNGTEFTHFKDIEIATGIQVFFADPYSSWQRGANENTNGLIRQYFPKGCDFRKMSKSDLAKAIEKINHRPRKCLGFKSPHEVRQASAVAI